LKTASLFLYRFLENEIHKTNLKLMEGDTIKKKYVSILDMLKQERLGFANQLENLEENFPTTKRRHSKSSLKKRNSHMFLLSQQYAIWLFQNKTFVI
jgi:hypothetical protein